MTKVPELQIEAWLNTDTPITILIDRDGTLQLQHFGRINDMVLGATIKKLVMNTATVATTDLGDRGPSNQSCSETGCAA